MRPTPQQEAYARETHQPALAAQMQHEHAAMQNRQNFASYNHGRPAVAATMRPADFSSRSVVSARAAGGEYRAPAMSPREARVSSGPGNRGNSPGNRGNANEGFRPFTPPNRGGNQNANSNPRYNGGNQGRFNDRPGQNQNQRQFNERPAQNQNRYNERGPQNQGRPESRPAPQPHMNSRPSPPPHQSGPPKEEHRGR